MLKKNFGMSAWPAWLPGPAWSAWSPCSVVGFLQGWKKINVALYCSIFVFQCTFTHISKSSLFRPANLAFICCISAAFQ